MDGTGVLDFGGNAAELSWLSGTGTVANAASIVLTNDAACTFGGVFSGDTAVIHRGNACWTFGGTHTGTFSLVNEAGTVTLAAADSAPIAVSVAAGAAVELGGVQHAVSALSGGGVIADGTVGGTFAVSGAVSVTNVAFAAGAKAVLNGGRLAFAGDGDLGNLTVSMADAMKSYQTGATTLLSTTGVFTGTPVFDLGGSAFRADLVTTESGSAYVLKYIGATVIKLK